MTTPKEIKEAVTKLMDVKKDDQWTDDGSPNLQIVQTLLNDDTLTAEQVAEATDEFKRPVNKPTIKTTAKKDVAATPGSGGGGATETPPAPPAEQTGVVPSLQAEANSPEFAKAKLLAAREASGTIVEAIKAAERRRDMAADEIIELQAKNDVHILDIEKFGPRVAAAEAVKAIQRQTQQRLADSKASAMKVSEVMHQTGAIIHPSLLDATLAMRRRSPEQQRNYAAFVHQNSSRQVAERG